MGGMCRVADQEFLQTNRGYAKILHLGAASVGVEMEGLEPSSKRGTNELSTCLVLTWFS